MKQLVFQRHVALTALLVVFVGGCAANMTASPVAEDQVITLSARPQVNTAPTAASAQPLPSGVTQTASGASVHQPPANKQDAVPSRASGLIIYIDPQTGVILKEPAPGTLPIQLSAELQNAVSTSHQGLVAVPSSVSGGGIIINLQGRFQSPLIATIDGDGNLKTQHLHDLPESGDRK